MRKIRTTAFLMVLAVTAVLVPPAAAANGNREPLQDPGSDAWMPDVAERVVALRERAARADAEARVRSRSEQARDGQWWRAVAAVPAGDRPR